MPTSMQHCSSRACPSTTRHTSEAGALPCSVPAGRLLQWPGDQFSESCDRCAPYCSLEHSIENQLPFFQHVLESVPNPGHYGRPLSIAPVCVGWLGSAQQAQQLGQQLLAALRQAQAQHPDQAPPLLIATSDFTHAVSCRVLWG